VEPKLLTFFLSTFEEVEVAVEVEVEFEVEVEVEVEVEFEVEVEVEVAGIIPTYKDPGGQILTKKMSIALAPPF
jgi:hypothetical protein